MGNRKSSILLLLVLSLFTVTSALQSNTTDYKLQQTAHCNLLEPGFLGVTYEQNTEGKGVIVLEVLPNTPADKYGVKKGDIIEAINDEEINAVEELQKAISGKAVGETVILTIKRDHNELKKEAKLSKRPAQYKNQPTGGAKFMEYLNKEEKGLKLALEKMEDDERKEFEELLHECEASTVRVAAGRGRGSGVLIEGGKYVATAGHVTQMVGEGGKIDIILPDGRNYKATVVKQSFNPRKRGSVPDAAIAEVINPKGDKLPSVELSEPKSGEMAIVMGYPGGRGKDNNGKIVSAMMTKKGTIPMTLLGKVSRMRNNYVGFASTVDAPPLPGNSGGPMFNKKGEVIAIVTNSDMTKGGYGTNASVIKKFIEGLSAKKEEGKEQGRNVAPHIRKAA